MDQEFHICVSMFSTKEECLSELMKMTDETSPSDIIKATECVNTNNPLLTRPEDNINPCATPFIHPVSDVPALRYKCIERREPQILRHNVLRDDISRKQTLNFQNNVKG